MLGLMAALALVVALAPVAGASKTRLRQGSLPTPTFENAQAMAVDRSSGNLLVVDSKAKTLSRWQPDGEPAPFADLGTNVIDAAKGLGGKECAEEPASCDETPQGDFEFGGSGAVQVAVDNSGAATDGDIYVTQSSRHLVDVFDSDGSYLNQLTASFGPRNEEQKFNNPGSSVTYNITIPGYGTTANIVGNVSGASVCNTYINPVLISAVGPGTHCEGKGLAGGPKTVIFRGALANTNIATMEVKEVLSGSATFPVETLTEGGTGPKPFAQPCGVAVDAAGAAYVADFGKEAIFKYVSQGAPHSPLVASDNTAVFNVGSEPDLQQPCTMAAGAGPSTGALFVNRFDGPAFKLDSASGALVYGVEGGSHKTTAVNPVTGHLFVLNNALANSAMVVSEFNAGGGSAVPVSSTYPGLLGGVAAEGIASSGATDRLYVSAVTRIDVYGGPVPVPDVMTVPPSGIGGTGATLESTVTPDGAPLTECKFEYGVTTAYGQSVPCEESPAAIGSGSAPVTVHAEIEGLEPEVEYHYRLTARNANSEQISGKEQVSGADVAFKTLGKPVIEGAWAANVLLTEATLEARINPEGLPTAYRFEWGPGLAPYEHSTDDVVGSDAKGHFVTLALTGLTPGSEYHWRVIATNGLDEVIGEDHMLTTYRPIVPRVCANQALRSGPGAALPDCRAYEMVSPLDKAGRDIKSGFTSAGGISVARNQSNPDGTKLTYTTERRFGDAVSQPFAPQYLASRSAAGWSSHGISPERGVLRPHGVAAAAGQDNEFQAFSEDLCEGWLVGDDTTMGPLAPGGIEGVTGNLYRRSDCDGGGYQTLGASELLMAVQGITADGAEALFRTPANLTQSVRPVGSGLKCTTPQYGEAALAEALSYRWLANGAPIAGATGSEYTATAAEAGKAVQCQIMAANAGGGSTQVVVPAWVIGPASATAPPVAPREIAAPEASAPLIEGGAGGQELSCDPEAVDWSGAQSFSYRWYRNGVALESAEDIAHGSQSPTYVTQAADLASAAAFQCVVSATNVGGTVARASANLKTSPVPGEAAAPDIEVLGEGGQMVYLDVGVGPVVPVCVAPGGETLAGNCSAGSATGTVTPYEASVRNALSVDGERVYWSSGSGLFLRENPGEPQSALDDGGNCTEAAKACTIPVSAGAALFWGAARDGSAALYSEGGSLYRFDVDGGTASLIAAGFVGVLGASGDLRRIYVVSEEVPGGVVENSEGDVAQAGEPNLYLYEPGGEPEFTFVATLAAHDARPNVNHQDPSPISAIPIGHSARVSPDGAVAAFTSVGSLTGYDNADVVSGEADKEVYRYDVATRQLSCVSCNPSGARPQGRLVALAGEYWAAARLPAAQHALYFPRALSENGNRIFFESFDALVIADTNGAMDVYQWEAVGEGDCTKASGSYSPQNEGCVALISSGKNPKDSVFFDATPDGSDIFFSTAASLVEQDPGLIDIYDARVEGGIAPPSPPPAPCEGEACQSAPPPPAVITPSSSVSQGAGNVVSGPKKRRCGKGKRRVVQRGKPRCVKKHRKGSQRRRADQGRRAERGEQ